MRASDRRKHLQRRSSSSSWSPICDYSLCRLKVLPRETRLLTASQFLHSVLILFVFCRFSSGDICRVFFFFLRQRRWAGRRGVKTWRRGDKRNKWQAEREREGGSERGREGAQKILPMSPFILCTPHWNTLSLSHTHTHTHTHTRCWCRSGRINSGVQWCLIPPRP